MAPVLVDIPLVVQDVDEVQPMPLASRKIVGVMRRSDLDGTRPETHVHQLRVQNDGQLSAIDRVNHMLPMQVDVPEREWNKDGTVWC